MDLSSATAAATFPVDVPSTELAASSNLTGVWEATDGSKDSQVVLEYDSGKLWIYENPLADPDPKAVLARYEDDMTKMNQQVSRHVFSIEYIGSTPLLLAQPNTDYDQTNAALVDFARGDIDVQLLSHSYTTDQLMQVAKTMVG